MASVAQRAVWLKPQSGTSVRRSGGTPAASTASIRSATSSGRLEVVVLDVDDARRDVPAGRGDLAEDLDLGHLAVGELEDELVDAEPEHRVEHRPVGPPRERTAEVVAEAQVRAEPDPADDRLDRRVEQRREVGRGVRMDGRRRVVDLDDRRAGLDQPLELRAQDRHERLGRGVAVAVDLAGPGTSAGPTACTARAA